MLAILSVSIAYADTFKPELTTDKKVVEYFHKLLPTTTINSIYTTPYPETYALIMGQNIVYGNLHSNYLTAGHMFDVYTKDDITSILQNLTVPKLDIGKINIADAVQSKSPNKVNKKLIIFIDPDCPYCRQLTTEIEKQNINKKADIYYMLMPLAQHSNAKLHTTNILCSKSPLNTLKEYMVNNNNNPKLNLIDSCSIEAILERTGSIVRNLAINATPTIITGDGSIIMGVDIQAINEYLKK